MARLKTIRNRIENIKTTRIKSINEKVTNRKLVGYTLTQTRRRMYEQAEGVCNHCGLVTLFEDYELDHITPLHLGGSDEDSNLQVLCKDCHRVKTNKEIQNANN